MDRIAFESRSKMFHYGFLFSPAAKNSPKRKRNRERRASGRYGFTTPRGRF